MGKQYKVVSINDVLDNAALQTKEYNSKQEYYDDDKTYFQMFHDNAESIINPLHPHLNTLLMKLQVI
ncbi:hypothetical protein ACCR80_26170 (plasmid) [Klebsiella pneumoniae]